MPTSTPTVASLTEKIREAAPHATTVLVHTRYGVSLAILSVPHEHRRTGQATAALAALTAAADAHGITLSLTPDSCLGTPTPILHRLYLAHGFRMNTGRARDHEIFDSMVRRPSA